MGYAIRHLPKYNLVYCVHWGICDPKQMLAEIRSPGFEPRDTFRADTLVQIMPNADLSTITPEFAVEIWKADQETFFEPFGEKPSSKLAFVCPENLDRIIMRMIVTLGHASTEGSEEPDTFTDLTDALSWLGNDRIAAEAELTAIATALVAKPE
ncbi:hypothetical protein HH303_00080 [Rhodospirillaceae bacterium KN72]|uniref:Uncharacterized protein n=1 Tax=Pacificispira spongiicola TaxID=2729598 RepID=A0A7Y0DWF1_9PROT|nr:hypothetical protein [Pacificispira spongiicola]NMM42854.1 hypothetical protein [Pacificispira spongiicola]